MESSLDISKEVIRVNAEKTDHMFMFRHHTAGKIISS
jgi:hypothetical protein